MEPSPSFNKHAYFQGMLTNPGTALYSLVEKSHMKSRWIIYTIGLNVENLYAQTTEIVLYNLTYYITLYFKMSHLGTLICALIHS